MLTMTDDRSTKVAIPVNSTITAPGSATAMATAAVTEISEAMGVPGISNKDFEVETWAPRYQAKRFSELRNQ